MIQSLADPEAELIWSGRPSRKLPADIQNVALRKFSPESGQSAQ
jgi:proteic killer suppression protein